MNYLILLQTVIAAVNSIETLMPQSAGADKFKAVITFVESVVGSVESQLPAIQSLVTALVSAYNLAGIFKKKAA